MTHEEGGPEAWPAWVHAALLAVFTAGQLLARGYRFGAEDSANYAMLVRPRLAPEVFAHDDVFGWIWESAWQHHAAFFTGLVAPFARAVGLEGAFFALHLIALYLLFAGFWLIGRALGGATVGWLTLVALLAGRWVGGTWVQAIPNEFQPRVLAAALAFLALGALANGARAWLAPALTGLATLLHPISAAMALPAVVAAPLLGEAPWRERLRGVAVAAGIALGPFVLWKLLQGAGPPSDTAFFARVGAEWQAIMDFRLQGQALNVGAWRGWQWLFVLVPLGAWLAALRARGPLTRADHVLGLAVLASVALAAAGIVGADLYRLAGPTQLMLSRLLYVPLVVGTAYAAWWLLGAWREGEAHARAWVALAFASLSAAAMPAFVLALAPLLVLRTLAADAQGRLLAHAFGLGWGALALAIALRGKLQPPVPGLATPDLLVFGEPPLVSVLALAVAGGVAIAATAALGERRAAAARVALAALAPLFLIVLTNRGEAPWAAIARHAAALERPGASAGSAWQAVMAWAEAGTPAGARFLTPPDLRGFRARAARPIVTDWKDGGVVMFSEGVAVRWKARYDQVLGYPERPPMAVLALAKAHGCAFVVMPAARPLPAPVAFAQGDLVVYDVRAVTGARP